MLYVYDIVVSEKVKRNRIIELKTLFYDRIPEKSAFFKRMNLFAAHMGLYVKLFYICLGEYFREIS